MRKKKLQKSASALSSVSNKSEAPESSNLLEFFALLYKVSMRNKHEKNKRGGNSEKPIETSSTNSG